ncbi:uncharacterized protein EDB91DRAFT_363746 [Suillus paluster]|uniref:uncharacterized protein n=1 Tax=Suillus paluster TaxID=48578 RepID=UPI001B863AFD|nr:uncharacterized protein EDB91DRAFT_363746 [Suillus paluster]KAG1740200.1 hypothetical protein EDB91DRAFT_363746 [Suillus paluster]
MHTALAFLLNINFGSRYLASPPMVELHLIYCVPSSRNTSKKEYDHNVARSNDDTLSPPSSFIGVSWMNEASNYALLVNIIRRFPNLSRPSLPVFDCSEFVLRLCSAGDKFPSVRLDVSIMTNSPTTYLRLHPSSVPRPYFENFARLSCVNVTTVHLNFPLSSDGVGSAQRMFRYFNDLVLYLLLWTKIKQNQILPPPVSYLGLHSKAPAFDFTQLLTSLRTMSGSKLMMVRLLHADTGRFTGEPQIFHLLLT